MAILVPVALTSAATEVQVLTTDADGKTQNRVRWLHQLGTGDIVCKPTHLPSGGQIGSTDKGVMIWVTQEKTPASVWKDFTQRPKAAVDAWLKKEMGLTYVGRLSTATRHQGKLDTIQVVANVPENRVALVLKKSGENGIFARPFLVGGETADLYKTVPVSLEHDLKATIRLANSWPDAMGVVPYGKGWGVRACAVNHEAALRKFCPHRIDRLFGDEYEVSGLPRRMCRNSSVVGRPSLQEVSALVGERHGLCGQELWITTCCGRGAQTRASTRKANKQDSLEAQKAKWKSDAACRGEELIQQWNSKKSSDGPSCSTHANDKQSGPSNRDGCSI